MKKFWKALGIATLAAAVPVRFKKDEATGKKTYQSLLISVDVAPNKDNVHTDIGINLGEGLLTEAIAGLVGTKKENHLFADDDPAAAVVEPILPVEETAEDPAPVEETAEAPAAEASEEDFDPEL